MESKNVQQMKSNDQKIIKFNGQNCFEFDASFFTIFLAVNF